MNLISSTCFSPCVDPPHVAHLLFNIGLFIADPMRDYTRAKTSRKN